MPKPKPALTFDPARLSVLAKARDAKRALSRAAAEKYQAMREELTELRRRAALTRTNAAADHLSCASGEKIAAELDAQADALRDRMATLQAEIDALTAEAADAGRVLSAALAFAKAEKLEIPPALAAEARDRVQMMGAA